VALAVVLVPLLRRRLDAFADGRLPRLALDVAEHGEDVRNESEVV
jgi:hypothetical protein